MEKLDISKLITKVEELIYNGRLNNAAYGKGYIQRIELEGNTFDLSIVAEAKYDKTNPLPDKKGMYVVKVEDQFEAFTYTTIGYWNEEEWERVRPLDDEDFSIEEYPKFSNVAHHVVTWKNINKHW